MSFLSISTRRETSSWPTTPTRRASATATSSPARSLSPLGGPARKGNIFNGQDGSFDIPSSSADGVAKRAGASPSLHYWTSDNLRYTGPSSGNCAAVTSGGGSCSGGPMRVCTGSAAGTTDALANRCTWASCGLGTSTPNQFFGGCTNSGAGYTTAGALCCAN